MKTEYITDQHLLNERLVELKAEKEKFEARISGNLKDLYVVVQNPAPVIKRTVKTLAEDTSVQADLLKIGINSATHFLIEKLGSQIASNGVDWLTKVVSKIASRKTQSK